VFVDEEVGLLDGRESEGGGFEEFKGGGRVEMDLRGFGDMDGGGWEVEE